MTNSASEKECFAFSMQFPLKKRAQKNKLGTHRHHAFPARSSSLCVPSHVVFTHCDGHIISGTASWIKLSMNPKAEREHQSWVWTSEIHSLASGDSWLWNTRTYGISCTFDKSYTFRRMVCISLTYRVLLWDHLHSDLLFLLPSEKRDTQCEGQSWAHGRM